MLEYSEACERNKQPIVERLQTILTEVGSVLEIGSGTAQHAVHFARHLPYLTWLTSDLKENIPAIKARLEQEGLSNIHEPVELDVSRHPWPVSIVDAVFTANTLHIMSWLNVQHLFKGLNKKLKPGGKLCIYGPFKYDNKFTSQSNQQFDLWLKQRDPNSGIRDFEAVNRLAGKIGLAHQADYAMPANNQLLVWLRQ